jgi:predicted NBD/HSP70 family sugar kinase
MDNRTRSLPILSSAFGEFLSASFTKSSSGSPAGLKRLNIARVFETVRMHSPIPRQEIGELSGLSKPTVNEAIGVLIQKNLVYISDVKVAPSPGKPGPKAHPIVFNSTRLKVVGIDVGVSKIRVLISDLDGNIIASKNGQTPSAQGGDAILKKTQELVFQALKENDLKLSDIGSFVAGTPGVVNSETGVVSVAHNFPDWKDYSLGKGLSKFLKADVSVENEAHLAIYGEYWKGGAQSVSNAAAMSVGIGIGLGLLINGQVYRGFNGIAGEVGNLPLQLIDKARPLTNANFEFQASAAGLERHFGLIKGARNAKDYNAITALADGTKVTAKIIYQAAAGGNKLAQELVSQQLNLLSRGIASVCCIINPEVFIIQGGLAPALEPYLDVIAEQVKQITLIAPKIILTKLSDLSTAYGALRRGIDSIDRKTLKLILEESL